VESGGGCSVTGWAQTGQGSFIRSSRRSTAAASWWLASTTFVIEFLQRPRRTAPFLICLRYLDIGALARYLLCLQRRRAFIHFRGPFFGINAQIGYAYRILPRRIDHVEDGRVKWRGGEGCLGLDQDPMRRRQLPFGLLLRVTRFLQSPRSVCLPGPRLGKLPREPEARPHPPDDLVEQRNALDKLRYLLGLFCCLLKAPYCLLLLFLGSRVRTRGCPEVLLSFRGARFRGLSRSDEGQHCCGMTRGFKPLFRAADFRLFGVELAKARAPLLKFAGLSPCRSQAIALNLGPAEPVR
jgi:hypothetical protein